MWIIPAGKKSLFETKAEEIFQWLKSDDIPENLRKEKKKHIRFETEIMV